MARVGERGEILIAHAEVYGQPRAHAPVVLKISAKRVLAQITLGETDRAAGLLRESEEKIRQGVPGCVGARGVGGRERSRENILPTRQIAL